MASSQSRGGLKFILDLVSGPDSASNSILKSRVNTLLTGDYSYYDRTASFADDEDFFSCMITMSVLAIGTAFFFLARGADVSSFTMTLVSRILPAPDSIFIFVAYLAGLAVIGLAASVLCMFLAARTPVFGFLLSACTFILTLSLAGMFTRTMPWITLIFFGILSGGVLVLALRAPHCLRYALVLFSAGIALLAVFSVLKETGETLLADFERMAVVAQIVLPIICLLFASLLAWALGAIFESLFSASSATLSPYTTSAYALCIISAALWLHLLEFVLRKLARSFGKTSAAIPGKLGQ